MSNLYQNGVFLSEAMLSGRAAAQTAFGGASEVKAVTAEAAKVAWADAADGDYSAKCVGLHDPFEIIYTIKDKNKPVWYTTDGGSTWVEAAAPEKAAGGKVSMSADGGCFLWTPATAGNSNIYKYDMVQDVKPGGTFLLDCDWSVEELGEKLPAAVKKYLANNNINFSLDGIIGDFINFFCSCL